MREVTSEETPPPSLTRSLSLLAQCQRVGLGVLEVGCGSGRGLCNGGNTTHLTDLGYKTHFS